MSVKVFALYFLFCSKFEYFVSAISYDSAYAFLKVLYP